MSSIETISIVSALLVSVVAPALVRPLLTRLGVIDIPNERSSHTRPILRGVGLAPLAAIAVGLGIALVGAATRTDSWMITIILGVSLAAALLGWIEDARGLPVKARAGSQLLIGFLGVSLAVVLTGEQWWLVPILGVGIAGYTNVANFMDGINGISGLHGGGVGALFALTGALTGTSWMTVSGLVVAVAFLGFLPWNLGRGGMFLGDVGSYLLGASVSVIAALAVIEGVPILAVVGPLAIYLADSGVTLVRRILRGEPWYEAHRTHVYQRLTDTGLSHVRVALIVSVATLATGLAGLIAVWTPSFWPLSAGLVVVIALSYLCLGRLATRSKSAPAARKAN